MDILLGVGVLAATTLLFAWGYRAHRAPVRARWVDLPGLSMLLCVVLTLAGPVGIGFLVKAALMPGQEWATLNIWALIATGALVVLAVVMTPVLIRPARHGNESATDQIADNDNNAPAAAVAA